MPSKHAVSQVVEFNEDERATDLARVHDERRRGFVRQHIGPRERLDQRMWRRRWFASTSGTGSKKT